MPGPDDQAAGEIRAALERLQSWPEIARSPQLSRLLGYIVERSLTGGAEAIKAYTIAVDVFERPPDFDPQGDPIVRVQARRLRNLLAEYYEGPGRDEQLRIVMPVGRYVPEFVRSAEAMPREPSPAPTRWPAFPVPLLIAFLVVVGVGAGVAAFALAGRVAPDESVAIRAVTPPRVGVVEFQNLTGNRLLDTAMAGLAVELVSDLDLFGEIDAQYGGGAVDGSPSDFVLTGIARDSGGRVQYSAILTRSASQAVEWSHVLEHPGTAADRALADDLSRDLSLLLGSSRGPLHASMRSLIAAGVPSAEPRSLYMCLMMFHRYRDTSGRGGADEVSTCFAELADVEQESPVAKAAMASLIAEGIIENGDRVATSEALITEAIQEGALSSFVWEQRARVHQAHGRLDLARQAYASALQLNPANADAMAAFALMLALHGDVDLSAELGTVALTGTPQPPPDWYFGAPAIAAFHARDFATAAGRASIYARADRELGAVLAALAALNLDNADMVNRFLPQVLDTASFKANGILPQLRKRIADPGLIGSIRWGLLEAGVPVAALDGPY